MFGTYNQQLTALHLSESRRRPGAMLRKGHWLLLLLFSCSAFFPLAAFARPPTFPRKITGRPSCMQPIKYMNCVRETRSKFVAGLTTSYGEGFGVHDVCSDGGINTFLGLPLFQEVWDMSVPTAPSFPKLPNGQPDLRYLHPYGAPITQMIVLQAPNPYGDKLGTIPAIIFGYLNTDLNSNITELDFAICGNADYAMFYLYPGEFPPPPTPVTLQAVYTNPLSEELPARYLGSFEGHCGLLGRGYLGGDPYKLSKLALKYTYKACFAALTPFIKNPGAAPFVPPERIVSDFKYKPREYRPCYYNKHFAKQGGTSWSCAMSGTSIAVGKYGAINLDKLGQRVGWEHDETTGKLNAVSDPELSLGTQEGTSQAAPAPTPTPTPQ